MVRAAPRNPGKPGKATKPDSALVVAVLVACATVAIVGLIVGLGVGLTRPVPASAGRAAPSAASTATQQRHESESAPRPPSSADEWRSAHDHRKVFRVTATDATGAADATGATGATGATDATTRLAVGGWYSYAEPGTWVNAADSASGGTRPWCKLVQVPDGGTRWSLYWESAPLASLTMSEVGASELISSGNRRISVRGLLRPERGAWPDANTLAMTQASGGKYHYYTLKRLAPFRDVWQMNMRGLSGLPWFLTTSGCPHVGGRAPSGGLLGVLYTYDATTKAVACVYRSETGTSDWRRVLDDAAQDDVRVYPVD
jgi:hypothetical protein